MRKSFFFHVRKLQILWCCLLVVAYFESSFGSRAKHVFSLVCCRSIGSMPGCANLPSTFLVGTKIVHGVFVSEAGDHSFACGSTMVRRPVTEGQMLFSHREKVELTGIRRVARVNVAQEIHLPPVVQGFHQVLRIGP